jgi:ribonuclease HIII
MTYKYRGQIGTDFELPDNGIYVYGANTEFRHGKGSALLAKEKYGAIYGQLANANPLQGQSYAIVTKNLRKKVHPSVPEHQIIDQIASMFAAPDVQNIPENVVFEEHFHDLVVKHFSNKKKIQSLF